ncbi:MAG: hypothetical protein WED05_01185 [Candidatus Atabeyarchaeum deiterrae]
MKEKQVHNTKKATRWPPLPGDYVVSNPGAKIAVMTCGSYDLPGKVIKTRADRVAIAGFCETENEGLAKIIQNIISNPEIRYVVVCGQRVKGHEPGQTFKALHSNGIDDKYTVIGSQGTIPTLLPTYFRGANPSEYVKRFQQQIASVEDLSDETSLEKIGVKIDELFARSDLKPLEMEPIYPPERKEIYDWKRAISAFVKRTEVDKRRLRNALGSMFTFTGTELQVYDLCGVKLGGYRGQYPTVMAGTIFYTKDKIVSDVKTGTFDRRVAAELIHKQDELSLHYSIPVMVHIVGQTVEAIEQYLLFAVDQTDSPIIVDSSFAEARIHGLRLAKDIGIEDRTIYNSIITKSDKERGSLKEIGGVKYAICLSYAESAEESDKKTSETLSFFKNIVEKPIIDPGVPRLGGGALSALEQAWILKNQFGFPTAIGIHNLHSSVKNHDDIRFDFDYTLPTIFGIDLNLYGPIKNAENIFPDVAGAEAAIADEALKTMGVLPRPPHPYYRLLGEETVQ